MPISIMQSNETAVLGQLTATVVVILSLFSERDIHWFSMWLSHKFLFLPQEEVTTSHPVLSSSLV
jgi:hypothetical protein